MKQSTTARPPSFFWQGLCILLPVALLAVIGFVTLQQDRRQVLHEAETRAQELATQLNTRLAQMIAAALVEDRMPASGFREQLVEGRFASMHSANTSNLAKVTVVRQFAETINGEAVEKEFQRSLNFVSDATDDLWLQDGDVIRVPDQMDNFSSGSTECRLAP